MSDVLYGGAKPLHQQLLKFTARSPYTVSYNDEEATVFHSQYAAYDIQDAIETIAERTDGDPRYDDDFGNAVEDAITHSTACFNDRSLRNDYHNREYCDARELQKAANDYNMVHTSLTNGSLPTWVNGRPTPDTRLEAIADVFTLMYARAASDNAYKHYRKPFLYEGDENDNSIPDPDADRENAGLAMRITVDDIHGRSVFDQPDPSEHLCQALYHIYEEVGVNPDARDVYGLIVTPTFIEDHVPEDAQGREFMAAAGRIDAAIMGANVPDEERWVNPDEPPLESLDSYTDK